MSYLLISSEIRLVEEEKEQVGVDMKIEVWWAVLMAP